MASGVRAAVLLLLGLGMVAPFLYMGASAFLGQADAATALAAAPFGRFFLNSAIFTLATTIGQLLTSTSAAYAFARLRFAGRDRLFLAYLLVLTLPAVLLVLPRYLLIRSLGWVDSYQGLISTELVSVGGIFLLRQFFLTIPPDLEDAARLEGASEWTVFRRVTLPVCRPGLVTLAVLTLAEQWKSFLWPLVATRSTAMRVLEVGIAELHGAYDLNWPYQMVAATAGMLPLLLLCIVAQNYFMRGIQVTVSQVSRTGKG